jgi:hypothetical protein
MGCPPDPEEVDIWRGNERLASLREETLKLHEELRTARAVLAREVEWRPVPDELLERVARANATAAGLAGALPSRTFSQGEFPRDSSGYADRHEQFELDEEAAVRLRAVQLSLCEVRALLLEIVRGVESAEGLAPELVEQRDLHLAHRREDREDYLALIREQVGTWTYWRDRPDATTALVADAAVALAGLGQARARVVALTDAQLLGPRTLLFELPEALVFITRHHDER